MTQLLKEIQHNKLLWLLIFVPVVFSIAHRRTAEPARDEVGELVNV